MNVDEQWTIEKQGLFSGFKVFQPWTCEFFCFHAFRWPASCYPATLIALSTTNSWTDRKFERVKQARANFQEDSHELKKIIIIGRHCTLEGCNHSLVGRWCKQRNCTYGFSGWSMEDGESQHFYSNRCSPAAIAKVNALASLVKITKPTTSYDQVF